MNTFIVGEEAYKKIAEKILSHLDPEQSYVSSEYTVTYEEPNGKVMFEFTLRLSAVLYWSKVDAPDRVYSELTDIVPVWWEINVDCLDPDLGPVETDFSFRELKKYLV